MDRSLVKPPSILLQGESGTGKTDCLATLIEAGLELFLIVTEPNGLEVLIDSINRRKLDINKLHYRVISPARPGFTRLLEMAKTIAVSDYELLAKMRPTAGRTNAQFITLLETICDFVCDRTGESFGPVSQLGPNRAVVLDSLSGLSLMAMDITIGDKVTAHQGEWGIAMSNVDRFLLGCTSDFTSLFVLTAHVERETEENSGTSRIMASTLGKKLAPRLPRFFSEVVMTYNDKEGYWWATESPGAVVKHRSLQRASKLPSTFRPIVEAWRNRQAVINQAGVIA